MTRFSFLHAATLAALTTTVASPAPLPAQATASSRDTSCSSCAEWNRPHAPARVYGNSYYVGTDGLSALLITSPAGHVLVDAALPESAPKILANITALGFSPRDVKLIVNSHAHFDHAGGLAALQEATGADVAISRRSAAWVRAGTPQPDDPQVGTIRGYPPVRRVREVADGDTVRVGPLRLVMTLTPGHTPGGTTWRWVSCDGARCLSIVYADSYTPLTAAGVRYLDNAAYPEGPADFPRSIERWRTMPCDLLITPHPAGSNFWARLEGKAPLVDSKACAAYADRAEAAWAERLRLEQGVTILRSARLIDGTGAAPIAPGMVRVEGDRITAVGKMIPIPAGARVIDLGDATLMPGLIDLHTHLTGDERIHWEDVLLRTTPAHDALWGARNARVTLMAGFTTCRDMGPTWPFVDVDLRDAINEGIIVGPRMLVAGNYVSSTGGAGDARQFSPYVDVPQVRNLADGPDEVTKAVRTNLKQGADFIKILATGAVLSKGVPPGAQQYSDAEIQAAVTEANRWGRMVGAHAHGADGIKAAIRAGVRTVDHGSYLDDEAVALLKATNRRTFYVPTLYTSAAIERSDSPVPESERARSRQISAIKDGGFRRALAAALPIGFGTDAMVIPHGQNAREFAERVRLGESPLAAITAATSLNAEIIGWQDRVGSLAPGKWADIIAVPGDPLADIRRMEQVQFVMKGGVVHRHDPR